MSLCVNTEKDKMEQENNLERRELLALTAEIVSAHVGANGVDAEKLGDFIGAVFATLSELAGEENAAPTELTPSVPIKRSVTDEHIVCLEDGKKLKMLKRHLMTAYGMTPERYRAKWGLKADYPMVAPAYARKRQELAIRIGLGRKPAEPVVEKPAPKPRAKRKAA